MQSVVTHQWATRVTLRIGRRRHHEVRAAVGLDTEGLARAGMMLHVGVVRAYRAGRGQWRCDGFAVGTVAHQR